MPAPADSRALRTRRPRRHGGPRALGAPARGVRGRLPLPPLPPPLSLSRARSVSLLHARALSLALHPPLTASPLPPQVALIPKFSSYTLHRKPENAKRDTGQFFIFIFFNNRNAKQGNFIFHFFLIIETRNRAILFFFNNRNAKQGNSTLIRFRGTHNSPRSEFFLSSALEFMRSILRCVLLLRQK